MKRPFFVSSSSIAVRSNAGMAIWNENPISNDWDDGATAAKNRSGHAPYPRPQARLSTNPR